MYKTKGAKERYANQKSLALIITSDPSSQGSSHNGPQGHVSGKGLREHLREIRSAAADTSDAYEATARPASPEVSPEVR